MCRHTTGSLRVKAWPGALLVLATALAVTGCTTVTLAIANAPAAFGDYDVRRNIPYEIAAGNKAQKLDVYVPPAATGPRPVVVFVHGGGWTSGSKGQYRFVAEALSTRGYVVVIPAYRLYPRARFPGFVEDAAQAVAWTREHIAEFGGDPAQLFLMGHSAGAHIAAMLTYDERFLRAAGVEPSAVAGFIGLAGAYDFLPFQWAYMADVFAPPESYGNSQPINFVDGTEPRTFLLHGLADRMVAPSNSKQLAARIRERGGTVQEHYYDGMSHGGVLATLSVYFRKNRTVLQEIGEFIEAPAGGKQASAQNAPAD
jgi:acetyl esterase/lipase